MHVSNYKFASKNKVFNMLIYKFLKYLPNFLSFLLRGYCMKETKKFLSELWQLLRDKEKLLGLNGLSFTKHDIFQSILNGQGEKEKISLEHILSNCQHSKSTFFRCFKKLRGKN